MVTPGPQAGPPLLLEQGIGLFGQRSNEPLRKAACGMSLVSHLRKSLLGTQWDLNQQPPGFPDCCHNLFDMEVSAHCPWKREVIGMSRKVSPADTLPAGLWGI